MDIGALIVVILPAIAAIVLLRRGLRGRRVGEAPYCKRCDFNLTGRPTDSTRCSECGADLVEPGAIVYGQRKRERVLIAAGVMSVVVFALTIGRHAVPAIRDFDPTPYKPVWWLVHDLKGSSQLDALNELIRRSKNDDLSPRQARSVADVALAYQADRSQKWEERYGILIELAHSNKHLAPEQWQTYARQAFDPSLIARPSARQGDPMPMNVRFGPARLGAAIFLARYQWKQFRVDGSLDVPGPKYDDMGARLSNTGGGYSNPTLGPDQTMTAELSVGTHQADARMHLEIWDAWDIPIMTERHVGNYPDEPPLVVQDCDATAEFEILSADTAVEFSVVDENLRAKMRESIGVNSVQRESSGNYTVWFHMASPPLRLCGRLLLRTSDREVVIYDHLDIQAFASDSAAFGRDIDLGDATSVSVVFAPDPERVRRSVDPSPTWGEEIIFENIPVKTFK